MLQVGDRSYQDATVRTKAKDYIIIVHSKGITSIKVTQLSEEVRERLGYASAKHIDPALTAEKVTSRGAACIDGLKGQISEVWQRATFGPVRQTFVTFPTVVAAICALLIIHLFCSYCSMLICQKAGLDAGMLVWLPVLQAIPMLQAASMSTRWFGAFLIPGLNVYAWGLWCIKIVAARQKTMPLAILLMFPLTSWFAFLFLAFSKDSREDTKVQVKPLTFQSTRTSPGRTGLRALLRSEQHIAA